MLTDDTFDRDRYARDLAAVRDVLLRDWDPIGVAAEPEAASEYDGDAARVYGILARGGSGEDVAAYLAGADFGLPPLPPARIRAAVAALLTLGVGLPRAHPAP